MICFGYLDCDQLVQQTGYQARSEETCLWPETSSLIIAQRSGQSYENRLPNRLGSSKAARMFTIECSRQCKTAGQERRLAALSSTRDADTHGRCGHSAG